MNNHIDTTRILVIDENEEYADMLSKYLEDSGIIFSIDWKPDYEDGVVEAYDLFVVGNHLNGGHRTIAIVETLSENIPSDRIFVISANGDYRLLKKLFELNVCGFLDVNDMQVGPVVRTCQIAVTTKKKLQSLSAKLDEIISI